MRILTLLLITSFLSIIGAPASARRTVHFFPIKAALESDIGKDKLLDVPVYARGEKAPKTNQKLGNWSSKRSTRGIGRSDEAACEIAFISAVISLQTRAQREGGDALVDLHSVSEGEGAEDGSYECVAGSTVVHVRVSGDVIRTK